MWSSNVRGQIACDVCRADQVGRMRIAGTCNADLGKLGIVHDRQVDCPGDVIFLILMRRARIDHQRVGRELFDAHRGRVDHQPVGAFNTVARLSRLGIGVHHIVLKRASGFLLPCGAHLRRSGSYTEPRGEEPNGRGIDPLRFALNRSGG